MRKKNHIIESTEKGFEIPKKTKRRKIKILQVHRGKKGIYVRIKMGKNPYSQEFTCSKCRKEWDNDKTRKESFFLRLEVDGMIIDFPICPKCFEEGYLLEVGNIDISKHHTSHPIYVA